MTVVDLGSGGGFDCFLADFLRNTFVATGGELAALVAFLATVAFAWYAERRAALFLGADAEAAPSSSSEAEP